MNNTEQIDPNSPFWFLGIVFMIIAALAYIIPTIIACSRNHPHRLWITLMNILLGGTGVFWLIALFWSLTKIDSTGKV